MLWNLLFPQQNVCHLCERYLEQPALLCPACEANLRSLRLPNPRSEHPPLAVCVSAFSHELEARKLVHALKYASDCAVAPVLGEALIRLLPLLGDVDVVLPVPAHPSRVRARGYNQAEVLARVLCDRVGLPMEPDLLLRTRKTRSQVGRSKTQRVAAMENAFSVPRPDRVHGRRIVLVDDVLTTGGTAVSCANVLLQAGAASVSLLTFCRA